MLETIIFPISGYIANTLVYTHKTKTMLFSIMSVEYVFTMAAAVKINYPPTPLELVNNSTLGDRV